MYHYHQSVVMVVVGDAPTDTHNLARMMEQDGVRVFSDRVNFANRNRLLDIVLNHPAGKAGGHWSSVYESLDYFRGGWNELKERIKHTRRYVVPRPAGHGLDLWTALETTNPHFIEEIPATEDFFRARLHESSMEHRRLESHEIGAPPAGASKAGRANASGIRVLYVADSEQTAIAEIRPHIGAIISVGRFRPRQVMRAFDLSKEPRVEHIDPFRDDFASELGAARLFGQLNKEFAEPIPPFTPERDYAPTQVVAEFLAEDGYAGLKYRSATSPSGRNWVFFDPEQFQLVEMTTFRVDAVTVVSSSFDPAWMQNLLIDPQQHRDADV